MSEFRVLIVEDDDDLREALCETLSLESIEVVEAASGPAALGVLERQAVTLVVSDIQMKPWSGLELLARIRAQRPDLPVVLMTAYGSVPQAVQAVREGAVDYLVKPVEAMDLIQLVNRFRDQAVGDEELLAVDPMSIQLKSLAGRVAASEVSVLLTGPSGSGKEAYARFIHRESSRRSGPFVAVNCAAIPDQMLEAELFGHEKGAFTGAVQARAGKFEAADGGTILLDEISEMDLALQSKLLRVLQEHQVERLGGNRTLQLDVRVIATTNRDLPAEVAAGRFREDLFYRLNVFPLQLPALASRPGDILPLAERLLTHYWRGMGPRPRFTQRARERLVSHAWPGNVRELENVVQRALVLAGSRADIEPEDLFFGMVAAPVSDQPATTTTSVAGEGATLSEQVADREGAMILAALRAEKGHRERTARRLGISPRTLRYKLSRLREAGLDIPGRAGPNFAGNGRTSENGQSTR